MPVWSSVRGFWLGRSRLEKTAAALIAAVIVLEGAGGRPVWLTSLAELLAVGAGFLLGLRYLRIVIARLMWRLRHRLLITYVFIGVVPVLLLLTMAALAGYLFYAQVATYLVGTRLAAMEDQLGAAAAAAARTGGGAEAVRAELPRALRNLTIETEVLRQRPAWLKSDFKGLVRSPAGHLARAAVERGDGSILVVTASAPEELLNRAGAGIGTVRFLNLDDDDSGDGSPGSTGGRARVRVGEHTYRAGQRLQGGMLPEAVNTVDIAISGLLTAPDADWDRGPQAEPAVLVVTTRPSLINARLFSTLGAASGIPLRALTIVAVAFLVIEVVSLWIGLRLTRTITGSVADLYAGTERIHAGDFTVRIPVRSGDQLAMLARSFNDMTTSLQQLIAEQKEKQRMQSELEIARDVQARLFPREVPSLRGLELSGVCQPARTVSGDYYDFAVLDGHFLALAIGDIAGKGISAALLMASIQSMLHAQLPTARGAGRNGDFGTALLVSRLNAQLHRSIAPGHFATFCFAVFDEASGDLTYTNAGHLPPLVLRGREIHRLRAGGTVLGVFPASHYDQETVRLERGDLFVAFTDGVTEPENSYGEEFGEQRLIDVLQRSSVRAPADIAAAVIAAVRDWTGTPELQDDMTLLVARRV